MFDDRIGNLQKMLARMGPEGRQRYAADHADDPIAVSMALFVNNIAKELKEGKRGEPEMQAPVVQQAIQAMNQPRMPQGMPPQGMPSQGQPQAPQGMPPQMAADGGYMDSRLPEEMGIGALPERSLSSMADGGIVGFADGGDVQRFQSGGTPKPRPMYPGMIGQEGEGLLPNTTGYEGMSILEFIQKFGVDAYNKIKNAIPGESTEARLARQKREVYDATPSGQRDKAMVEVNASAPVDSMNLPPRKLGPYSQTGVLPEAVGGGAEDPNGASAPRLAARPAVAPTAAPSAARPTADAGAGASPTISGLASLAAQYDNINTKGMSRADILAAKEQFEKGIAAIDPVAKEREALNAKSKRFSQDALNEFEKETKDRPDPYAKREERANKQEASIAESAERNPYLSLMEAGFAMMSGTSQYAFENIGKGALVGTKAYKDGLDKIEKAKEKLSETRDKIEDYRIYREDLTSKERRAFKTDIRNTELAVDKSMLDGMALAFNIKREDVNSALKAFQDSHNNEVNRRAQVDTAKINALEAGQRTMYSTDAQVRMSNADRASRETVAANALSALPPEARLAKLLGNGDLETGLRKLQEISADKSGAVYAQMFAKEVADARKELRDPPSAEEYAKSIRAFLNVFKPTVVDDSKVKGSPTVYPRPSP